MSLITLTFGENYRNKLSSRHKSVTKPFENLKPSDINKLEVKKINQFFGERNIYVIGEVKDGVLIEKMKSIMGEKTAHVVEIETKFGNTNAKKGMAVGITLAGIEKEDLQKGQILDFTI